MLMTSCLVSIIMLLVRIVFAENCYPRVWLEKALSLDFIKGNQTVPFNGARPLSLQVTYTLSAIYVRVQSSVSVTFFIIYRLMNILLLQLLLQLLLTIEILGEFYCDASYYASSNIVSSCWLTFWESEKTEQKGYFRSLAIKKTVRTNNTNSCTEQIQGPRKTAHI